jgi:plastocyanin
MRSRHLLRALLAVLIALATGFGIAALSPASAHAVTSTTWTVQVGSESPHGQIQGMNYGPGEIWIDVGDTVHWVAAAMEPHTVSFVDATHPAVEFNPFDPSLAYMVTRTPQTTISEPGQYRNSGVMDTVVEDLLPLPQFRSYDLTFTGPGNYTYLCYVHGVTMSGVVHVRAAGTPYPHSQHWYSAEARMERAAVIADGERIWSSARSAADAHHVFVGVSDTTAMVMAFTRSHVTVHVGESVTFDWGKNAFPVPHTVTFGPEPAAPVPVGDPTHYAGGTLSSGILLAPATYKVTFTKAGTYGYLCMLHDHMGMVGSVTVLP